MPSYIYGFITLNSGERFRARREEETGKVTFMAHTGQQNASKKIKKTFQEGIDAFVPSTNRYRFADELQNPHMSHASSDETAWKIH